MWRGHPASAVTLAHLTREGGDNSIMAKKAKGAKKKAGKKR